MKKIVLVKSEAKNAVIAKLFEESKNGCLPEVEVIDIERWIDHFFPNPKSLYQLKKELMSLDLVIFKDSLDDTGFLREVKNDSSKLSQYIDNFDTLPINEELKIILTIARERDYRLLCNQLEKLDASNIVIADLHYDLKKRLLISYLLMALKKYLTLRKNQILLILKIAKLSLINLKQLSNILLVKSYHLVTVLFYYAPMMKI